MAHLYKSRLQNYAQKRSISFPTYSCEMEGPPHARLFKAKVTIDGVTYEGTEYCTTLKDAEHSVAKLAFMSLAPTENQEDDGLSKSLLQELTQKKGLHLPVYATQRTGPPHMPSFVSDVEVAGETFRGQEAKTKKQAEMNAAKVAYNALVEGGPRMNSETASSDTQMATASNLISQTSSLQPVVLHTEHNSNNKLQTSIKREASYSAPKEAVDEKGEAEEEHILISPPIVIHESQPNATPHVVDATQLNIRRENLLTHGLGHGDTGPDSSGKRNRSSSPNDGSSDSAMEQDAARSTPVKIRVRPHRSGMMYDGPIQVADDEWVAMIVKPDE